MDYKTKTFKAVISSITAYFITQRKVSERCILSYRTIWRKLENYLDNEKISFLNTIVCKKFLTDLFDSKDYTQLTSYERSHIRTIHDLIEYIETGTVQRLKTAPSQLSGSIGSLMTEYIQYRTAQRIAAQTAYMYELYLSEFFVFLNHKGIVDINEVNHIHILTYLKGIKTTHEATIKRNIIVLRGFFRYLYEENILSKDYSRFIPKDGYKNRAKLPSTYNEQEIKQLLESVDRSNSVGKRDYAILLLAIQLGLRASDIANLKFSQLNWAKSCVQINQVKTGELLELPLLPEVGNAIIDYLKYGRQQTDSPYIFIIARSPYNALLATSIYTIVSKGFERAKINTLNKKRGPHALRHSLAGQLLERQSILPVISEVLGHKNTELTKYYLSIDLRSLHSCTLEIPLVATSFYLQKGGYFMNDFFYKSVYAPYINDLIAFKRTLGFKYNEEANIYRRFDTFIREEGVEQIGITRELYEKWRDRIPEESDSYKYARCVCVNQLAAYLSDIGIPSTISRLPKRRDSFTPYVFSKQEMSALFEASNQLETNQKRMNSVIFSIPILLRFLYSTGLRIGEALSLNNEDINLSDNFCVVKDSKNRKERLVTLSETLTLSCKEYLKYKEKLPISVSIGNPFFIPLNGARYTQSEAYHWFRKLLIKSKIPFIGSEHKHRGPRIHDLRHTTACHALAQMAESGMDLYCSLPILSAFLGHQSLKATDVYVRLTAEMYPELIHKVNTEYLTIFPKIEYESNGLL